MYNVKSGTSASLMIHRNTFPSNAITSVQGIYQRVQKDVFVNVLMRTLKTIRSLSPLNKKDRLTEVTFSYQQQIPQKDQKVFVRPSANSLCEGRRPDVLWGDGGANCPQRVVS